MRSKLLWCAALVVAACDVAPTVDATGPTMATTPFGTFTGGGGPVVHEYGDKRGPAYLAWSDVPSPAAVPATTKAGGSLPGASAEPDVLVGTVAVFTTSDGSATVAYDLAAGEPKWQITDTRRLVGGGTMVTDGHVVCGRSLPPANPNDPPAFACLDLATGADRWRLPPSWNYQRIDGKPTELLIGPGVLVLNGKAYDLATGAVKWTSPAFGPEGRSVAFVGSDVVLGGASCTGTNAPCLVALDPATGQQLATQATSASPTVVSVEGGSAVFFAVPSFGSAQAFRYDAATHAFTDVTTTFQPLLGTLNTIDIVSGLTPPAEDGTLYVGIGNSFSTGFTAVCRWDVKAMARAWCTPGGGSIPHVRVHPNAVFTGRDVFSPTNGQFANGTFARWFGHWGFQDANYLVVE